MMYNVANKDGDYMLLVWCRCRDVAVFYLHQYQERYPAGKPYPNGKGVYPDFGFRLVEKRI